jgi:hypothetical protein
LRLWAARVGRSWSGAGAEGEEDDDEGQADGLNDDDGLIERGGLLIRASATPEGRLLSASCECPDSPHCAADRAPRQSGQFASASGMLRLEGVARGVVDTTSGADSAPLAQSAQGEENPLTGRTLLIVRCAPGLAHPIPFLTLPEVSAHPLPLNWADATLSDHHSP